MNKPLRASEYILLFLSLAVGLACGGICTAAADNAATSGRATSDAPAPVSPNPVREELIITVLVEPPEVVLGEAVCIYGSLTELSGEGVAERQVQVTVSPPRGDPSEVFYATTDANGDYVLYFQPACAGKGWAVTALWPGDKTYDEATSESPALFDVLPADTQLTIASSAYAILQYDTVNIFGRLKPTAPLPPNYELDTEMGCVIFGDGPNGAILPPGETNIDANYRYSFRGIELPEAGVWRLWVKFGGSPDLSPSTSEEIHVQVKKRAGYAILVPGRGEDDTGLDSHNRTGDTVYHKLRFRGFKREDIFYLRFGVPADNGILLEGPPSVEAIRSAITTWVKERMTAEPAPLFIIFIGSGEKQQFYVSGEKESVRPWELDDWITSLETSLDGTPAEGQPITFIYGAPYSGSFIHWLSRKERPRAIITSSDPNEVPVTGPEEDTVVRQGDFFVLELFENLWRGRNLKRSFEEATEATRNYTRNMAGNGLEAGLAYPDRGGHHPLLDDNGDGIGSFGFLSGRPGDDGFLSGHIFLGYGEQQPEAQIVDVPPKQLISPGEQPDLWAKVNDRDMVEAVWMVVKPPYFSMGLISDGPPIHRDVQGIHVPLFDLGADGLYSGTDYPKFAETGTYTVLFFVKDRYTGQLGEIRKTRVVVLDPQAADPGEFSILSPEDGATVGLEVLLSWSESQKGRPDDEITYTVEIATDPSFGEILFQQSEIEGTSLLVGKDSPLLDRTTYYWRVTAETFFGKARLARSTEMRSTDIGRPLEGDTRYDRPSDSYTVVGNGWGSAGGEDQLRFVHTSVTGSFEVTARLDFLNGIDSLALAGIMIRASTNPASPYAMVAVNADGDVFSGFRRVPGSSAWTHKCGTVPLPGYIKLVCVRQSPDLPAEITPYFSQEGETWYPGTPVNLLLKNDFQVGICVTSGTEKELVKAIVSEFTISPLENGEGRKLKSSTGESTLSSAPPPVETLGTNYSTFTTNQGAGLPGYNVLSVLVYNQNDTSQSPPGTAITITPIVGTINNWMYSGYVPVGDYSIDVSAPNFSPEHRMTQVTIESPATEVFTLVPDPGSVSGKVIDANDSSIIRAASVQLEVTSGTYLGATFNTATGTDGTFSLTGLYSAVNYQITVSKTFYNDYQAPFTLQAGEAKNLGTISLGFTDDDSDGLPDQFEQLIVDADPGDDINSIWDVLPGDDFDGDGQSNEDEYPAGTNPTSSSSCLRIVSIVSNTSDAFAIVWTSVSGMLYKVYYGDTVGGWSVADSDIPGSGTGENSWTDDDTSGTVPPPGEASIRFYRVEAY